MSVIDLRLGDCLDVLKTLPSGNIDAVVTDPPYGLKFMGKGWDHGVPGSPYWEAVRRVMRPGAYLLSFGGTRTFHRQCCAIEDAGFEIRDTLMWVYGSGFPKAKSCLKPAWEPVTLALNPGKRVPELNVDACRVETAESTLRKCSGARNGHAMNCSGDGSLATAGIYGSDSGRYPANLAHDGSPEVLEAFAAFGERSSGGWPARRGPGGIGTNGHKGHETGVRLESNSGTAARFFYCAKASRKDRNEGLEGMPCRRSADDDWVSESRKDTPGGGKPTPQANHHPTVKPTDLMRWLCRLITPPGGTVLDPFAGSGSTGKACALEGFGFIGIERDPAYYAIAARRIEQAAAARAAS